MGKESTTGDSTHQQQTTPNRNLIGPVAAMHDLYEVLF